MTGKEKLEVESPSSHFYMRHAATATAIAPSNEAAIRTLLYVKEKHDQEEDAKGWRPYEYHKQIN
jgi:hypothetical protein